MNFSNYLSLVKFSHTIFAMPFAIIGFFMAVKFNSYIFDYKVFILVILDMIFARNAAMAFNRYLDREFDKNNTRTTVREIPSGKISEKSALIFVIFNSLLFIVATFFINKITFFLSPVALFVILGYSYTKRFTPFCHLILGIGLGLAPIGAFLAVSGEFQLIPIFLSFVVLFWVSGFDIIYALQDDEFDREHSLKSIPVILGRKNALRVSLFLHLNSILILLLIGFLAEYSYIYWFGFSIFSLILVYQHTLIKPNNLSKVNLAFFTLNGIASAVFAIFFVIELLQWSNYVFKFFFLAAGKRTLLRINL